MKIIDSFFTVVGETPASTREALRHGIRIDSYRRNCGGEVCLGIPDRFAKFASLQLDSNARAILSAVDSVCFPPGDRIGVFVTVGNAQLAPEGSRYANYDMLPGIIAYVFNTSGPALYVASTCDSFGSMLSVAFSMMASRMIDGALVAASNMILDVSGLSHSPILSASGVCRPFSLYRDGSYPGLGYGALSLSRTGPSPVFIDYALTRTGGSSRPSFTAPSVRNQFETMKEAWELSNFSFCDALFIESHGTGTKIGDMVEAEALRRVMADAGRKTCLVLGASKASLGHLDACAGLASIVSAVDCLETAHYPNVAGSIEGVPDEEVLGNMLVMGKGDSLPRRSGAIGVTMNGISGSTTHLVIGKD